jgi:hypothetical protein
VGVLCRGGDVAAGPAGDPPAGVICVPMSRRVIAVVIIVIIVPRWFVAIIDIAGDADAAIITSHSRL